MSQENFLCALKEACHFFSIGCFVKCHEIGQGNTHRVLCIITSQGKYVFKFYGSVSKRWLAFQLRLNCILIKKDFLTPRMYGSCSNEAYFKVGDGLVTCFDFIESTGLPGSSLRKGMINKINREIFRLKEIVNSDAGVATPVLPRANLSREILSLISNLSLDRDPFRREFLRKCLMDLLKTYSDNKRLFRTRLVDSDFSLWNLIISGKRIYFLDLDGLKTDCELMELASFVVSCFSLGVQSCLISEMIRDYFVVHGLPPSKKVVLMVLVKFRLINALGELTKDYYFGRMNRHLKKHEKQIFNLLLEVTSGRCDALKISFRRG